MRVPPVLHNPDYRAFWAGQTSSAIGSQFTVVAMGWHMLVLTDSALLVGVLGLCRALPQMVLAIFGGMLADSVDRRRLMLVVQLAQSAVSFSLAALTLTGAASPVALIVAALCFSLGNSLEYPSRQAIVPNLVSAEDLAPAVALFNTTRSIGAIIGPALAGVTLAVSGPGLCYVVDGASWLAMFVALFSIRRPMQVMVQASSASLEVLLAGVRYVFSQPVIFFFMLLDFGATFLAQSVALLPIYARDILHAGGVGLGVLHASTFVGAMLAGLLLTTVRVDHAGRWVLLGVAFYAVSTIGFAFAGSLWLASLCLCGVGAGNAFSAVLRGTSNQLLTPDHLRGRVAAFNSVFTNGGPQLGQFRSGVVAELGGARLAAGLGGAGALLLVMGVALVPSVRRFRLSSVIKPEPAVEARSPSG